MKNSDDSRWWEFYGIRYAQGSVVGAIIVYFLFSKNPDLKTLLFIPEKAADLGIAHLILYAAYGLVYCYIASAPILILHAGRGLIYKSTTNPNPYDGKRWRSFCLIFIPLFITSLYIFTYNKKIDLNTLVDIGAMYVYSGLVTIEAIVLIEIFLTAWDKTIAYNIAVIKKRGLAKNANYVESYKHLREHGNSFFIVLLEFFLAYPIYQFVSLSNRQSQAIVNLALIIVFWIFPAAIIWFFGNKLENHLQNL